MTSEKKPLAQSKAPAHQDGDHDRFDQASTLADGHHGGVDPKVEKIMEDNAKLANPLAGMGREKLLKAADDFSKFSPFPATVESGPKISGKGPSDRRERRR